MGVARLDIDSNPARKHGGALRPGKGKTIHLLFLIGLCGKLVDGGLEIIGAAVLFFFGSAQLSQWALILAKHELTEDPDNFIARTIAHSAPHLAASSQLFAVLFLLGHGVVKVGLVVALLRRYRWAYLLAIVIFGLFVLYQTYRYFHTWSVWLLALTALDLVVIVTTWLEYYRIHSGSEWAGKRSPAIHRL